MFYKIHRWDAETQKKTALRLSASAVKKITTETHRRWNPSSAPLRLSGITTIVCWLLFLFGVSFVSAQQHQFRKVENDAFQSGEFLQYRVFYDSWLSSWLTAGIGTMEIDTAGSEKFNGRDTYHITVRGFSVGLFSVFFKVRDKFESYVDREALMPWKFIRYTREGGYKKDDTVYFDQAAHKAHSMRAERDISPYVQDIVSAFYFVRTWNFDTAKVNDTYDIDFFLDDSLYHGEVIFLGREKVKTDFGKINCLKFKPRAVVGEVFQDPYPMELLVTDDGNKIPVVMRSGVFIGSVKIELVEYKGLKYKLGSKPPVPKSR